MKATEKNNVKVFGDGEQPMLFAHGYGCDQNMWRLIYPSFQKDYKIILFDHVGFGSSDVSAYNKQRYTSLHAYADDLLEICKELDLKDIIFVGHSVSAMIGVLAATKQLDLFEKLILIAPSPRYIDDGDYIGGFSRESIEGLLASLDSDYLSWSNTIAPVIMGNPDRPELGEELTNSFCRSNLEVSRDFAHITFLSDSRADLKNVKMDTLILQCSEDVIAPLPVGEYVHNQIKGSKFIVLEATGHCPNLSAPEETVAAMTRFLTN